MLGPLIGRGNTADVFILDNNKVIKLFHTGYPLDAVRHEFENSKLVNGLEFSAAKSYELLSYDGRHGIVYDRIDGESMLDLILGTKDLDRYSTVLAQLHQKMLAQKLPFAVSHKSILKRNIERSKALHESRRTNLLSILEGLPDGDTFCHGDFHFGNVIISREKYYIIDYMNVCRGHEYGDIARTVYLIEMTPVPDGTIAIEPMLQMKKQTADIYLQKMGVDRECLSDWLMIIAAARLSELNQEQIVEKNTILAYLSAQGLS